MKIGIALQIEKRETSRKTEETFVRGTGEGVHMERYIKGTVGGGSLQRGGQGGVFVFSLSTLSLFLKSVSRFC